MAKTEEERKEANRERAKAHSKRKHAEAAIAAGREPYKPGRPSVLTDEERVANRLASKARYREKNAERLRVEAKDRAFKKRHDAAAAEGREILPPGKHIRPVVPEEQKLENIRRDKRKWAENNPQQPRKYYLANREKIKVKVKEHKQRFREEDPKGYNAQRSADSSRRRARILEAGGSFSKDDVLWLWDQQHGNCAWCLKPLIAGKFHVDHYVPLARGGSNDRGNLRLLHKKCNLEKSARDPIEHGLEHGLLVW